ncbi:hypothetical protein NUSPORA_02370 [Nucleospora cyclopteri]
MKLFIFFKFMRLFSINMQIIYQDFKTSLKTIIGSDNMIILNKLNLRKIITDHKLPNKRINKLKYDEFRSLLLAIYKIYKTGRYTKYCIIYNFYLISDVQDVPKDLKKCIKCSQIKIKQLLKIKDHNSKQICLISKILHLFLELEILYIKTTYLNELGIEDSSNKSQLTNDLTVDLDSKIIDKLTCARILSSESLYQNPDINGIPHRSDLSEKKSFFEPKKFDSEIEYENMKDNVRNLKIFIVYSFLCVLIFLSLLLIFYKIRMFKKKILFIKFYKI